LKTGSFFLKQKWQGYFAYGFKEGNTKVKQWGYFA